jgi:6-pyruvoyltetrahydropterin/6-carboxytetrahydropterin synthase
MTTLTRRYRFSASHRLHSPALSESENNRVYGKCNNPFGHGHDYSLDVTVAGPVSPETGLIVPIPALDSFIERHVLRLFAYRNLNLDVPQFAHLVPTTENLALVIADLIERYWPAFFADSGASPRSVKIDETDRNRFEVLLPAPAGQSVSNRHTERAPVHV